MYFVTNGLVNLVSIHSNTTIKQLGRNAYFGDISFFSNILQHNCSAVTADFTTLFALKKNDFLSLFDDPEFSRDHVIHL